MSQENQHTVIIVGAGLSGICMGIALKKMSVDFLILEKSQNVSGTWQHNTYPGCGCDIPMFAYCYSFEPFNGDAWPKQPEIREYFKGCIKKHGLEDHIRLGVAVKKATFDNTLDEWDIEVEGGGKYRSRFVINATGQLNTPYIPNIEGIKNPDTEVVHSARYPEGLDTKGKTIAIIGNGATSLQLVESLQPQAKELLIFSRSPKYVYPRMEYSPLTIKKLNEDPNFWNDVRQQFIDAQDRYRSILDSHPGFDPFDKASDVKEFYSRSGYSRFDEFDEFYSWAAKRDMRPEYPTGCSRPLVSNTFHNAIRSDNVRLVRNRIDALRGGAVSTESGDYPVDLVILATGFSLNNLIPPYMVKGREGVSISQRWRNMPSAYLGMIASGFPNFFFLYGPNTNTNSSSVTFFVESQVNYIAQIFKSYMGRPFRYIDVKRDVMNVYMNWLGEKASNTSESTGCSSWYKNSSDVNISTFPGTYREYESLTERFDANEFNVIYAGVKGKADRTHQSDGQVSTEWVAERIKELFSETTQFPVEDIALKAPLREYSLDSILIVDFIRRINKSWFIELEPTILFEFDSLLALSNHIESLVLSRNPAQQPEAPTDHDNELANTDTTRPFPALDRARIDLWKRSKGISDSDRHDDEKAVPHIKAGSVAIIGAHGYFPGANDLESFWENLVEGRNCISTVPSERWDSEEFYGDPAEGDKTRVVYGGFIDGVDQFDPFFFKMSPKEASLTDPQHRLFLQCSWELFEQAGYNPYSLSGNKIGVILGINLNDYAELVRNSIAEYDMFEMSGLMHLFGANRVSYLFGFTGPSEVIDTACSSSLIAIHRAVQSILHDQCEMMLVGGSNLILGPKMHLLYSKAGMLSEDGKCKTFSDMADGYVRGEGVAAVLLKRLSDAERDGDRVLGVIRGSAENHGGSANSLTAPNPRSQARLIEEAMISAKIDPRTIGYIECHGTGTALGDPIEINGIKRAYENLYKRLELDPPERSYCGLGSVKTNIGHLETSAGIAGVIKVLLSFQHKRLPGSLNSQPRNEQIHLEKTPFHIVEETRDWDPISFDGVEHPRRAAVSSFGAGGSNAHIVLEEHLDRGAGLLAEYCNVHSGEPVAVLLSAGTADQLRHRAGDLLSFLLGKQKAGDYAECGGHYGYLFSMGYTLQVGRQHMNERVAFLVRSVDELADKLKKYLGAELGLDDVFIGVSLPSSGEAELLPENNHHIEACMKQKNWRELIDFWVKGGNPNWNRIYTDLQPKRLRLPTYPFMKRRCWINESPENAKMNFKTEPESESRKIVRSLGKIVLPGTKKKDINRSATRKPTNILLADLTNSEVAEISEVDSFSGNSSTVQLRPATGNRYAISQPGNLVSLDHDGKGVFTMRLIEPNGIELGKALIDQIRRGLHIARQSDTIRTLVICGGQRQFLMGGRAQHNQAIREALYTDIAEFPYPIIASMRGDAQGAGFILAALCDFMVCNEGSTYGYTSVEKAIFPTQNEVELLCKRFGHTRADDLLYISPSETGAGLRRKKWNVAVCREDEVEQYTSELAAGIAEKPAKSLRLLKGQLARDILNLTCREVQDDPAQIVENDTLLDAPSGAGSKIEYPEFKVKIDTPVDKVLSITLCDTRANHDLDSIRKELADLFCQLNGSQGYRVVIVRSEHRGFLPDAKSIDENVVFEITRIFSESEIPVIAVLESGANATGWYVSQFCDSCVYAADGEYSFSGNALEYISSYRSLAIFRHRLGESLGREVFLAGDAYTGADLSSRHGALLASEKHGCVEQAYRIAEQWLAFPRYLLMERRKRAVATASSSMASEGSGPFSASQLPLQIEEGNKVVEIPLSSTVMKVQLHPGGVLEVGMEDREAKNMFSEKSIAGIREVFGHIKGREDYKVIVLTGYGNYFSCGGTKEILLAIQEGRIKFTDTKIYQLAMECEVPVIAAMQGHGIGAGWSLGMFADFHIFGEESKYLSPYMRYGFTPGAGSTLIFPEQIGYDLARETMLLAREYSGHELKERGLYSPVLRRKEVLPEALRLARKIASWPRNQLVALKDQWTRHLLPKIESTYERELAMHEQTFVGESTTLQGIQSRFTGKAGTNDITGAVANQAGPDEEQVNSLDSSNNDSNLYTEIVTELGRLLAGELHIGEEDIDLHGQFVDMGLDSISGVTWLRKVNSTYGLSLEATQIYSYPTLLKFSQYVVDNLKQDRNQAGNVPESPAIAKVSNSNVAVAAEKKHSVYSRYKSAASDHNLTDVLTILRKLLADEIYVSKDEIDKDLQFVDLGLDSVSGVSWIRKVNQEFGSSIAATEIYQYPTLDLFSKYVWGLVDISSEEPGASAAQTRPEPVTGHAADSEQLMEVDESVFSAAKSLLAQELYLNEDTIDDDIRFVDLGLDSVSAVTWVRNINKHFGTSIDATQIYSSPTLNDFARAITGLLEPGQCSSRLTSTEPPTASIASPHSKPQSLPSAMEPKMNVAVIQEQYPEDPREGNADENRQKTASIAIIGMAGQFPKASDLDEYWKNISEGRDCISEVPRERWDPNVYYQENKADRGKTNSKWLGALEEYDLFDPLFFSISPTEAERMDPQQRLFLQICWHGIESAGYNSQSLSGSKCGVFVGCSAGDYHLLSREQQITAQGFTGDATSILAARVSYILNLQGPCLAIDTSCSSSLVAIASACDSLVAGNSEMALAGGVYVMAGPEMHIKTAHAGMLSTDGRCFSFDQRANGFVVGEGVGVVVLKELSAAERDNDIIRAVISGWGVNQDGKTNGITAPNAESQTRLQKWVYDRYNIDPSGIQLIEAHGTGTKLGDPIEVQGLTESFREYTDRQAYCALGSVKSNIGHCLTAAGIAGVLKVSLALKHRRLPPTINFENLNEHIKLKGTPFYINRELNEWPLNDAGSRQAAISSFGFSGTNAHVVIREYLPETPTVATSGALTMAGNTRLVFPLSAKNQSQLKQKVRDLADFIASQQSAGAGSINVNDLEKIAYTLQVGRDSMKQRLGIVANSASELEEWLRSWLFGGHNDQNVFEGTLQRGLKASAVANSSEINQLIERRETTSLLKRWVTGAEVDWVRLYGDRKPGRTILPLYPFAKERYWIDSSAQVVDAGSVISGQVTGRLHPLIHENVSDYFQQCYRSRLFGNEFFLSDHKVHQEKVLPGVAYLEMARAATQHALGLQGKKAYIRIENTVWVKPIVVEDPKTVMTHLSDLDMDDAGNGRLQFQIVSSEGGEESVHCYGEVFTEEDTAKPDQLNIDQLFGEMNSGQVSAVQLYAAFSAAGLDYGNAHQGVERIYQGNGQLLAHLGMPQAQRSDDPDLILHPSLLDSALQACASLIFDLDEPVDAPPVPFSMASLQVLSGCPDNLIAWARYSSGSARNGKIIKLDIDLCDQDGTIFIQIRGFSTRAKQDEKPNRVAVGGKAEIRTVGAVDKSTTDFDQAYYGKIIDDILKSEISIDEALELG